VSGAALPVTDQIAIPRHELSFRATRAGGPGGQHVNTSSTRVELLWRFQDSRVLTEEQRARIRQKLAARIDAEGQVRVVSSAYRSQARNREAAGERLAALVRAALAVPKARRKTRPTRHSVEERLSAKRKASEKKRERRPRYDDA
jgi:ribosome-associated protein